MRYMMTLESSIARWLLFGDKVKIPIYVREIVNRFYPKERDQLRERVCPWCGKKFSSGRTLKLHLRSFKNHPSCQFAFNSMVRDIASMYLKVREIKNRKRAAAVIRSMAGG